MRVAFYITDPLTDAVAAMALSWARHLALQYPDDHYLVLSEHPLPGDPDPFLKAPFKSIVLPPRYSLFPFWSDIVLTQKLFAFTPDLLITTAPRTSLWVRCKQARVTAKAGLVVGRTETLFAPLVSAAYKLLSTDEKHAIKEQWSFGREYFMLTGSYASADQLTLLLQAFSLFKNRQQSGLKLVLPFALSTHYPSLAKKIEHYKYRNALVITGSIASEQVAQLSGAAYALVALGSPGSNLLAIAQARRVGLPLLTLPDPDRTAVAQDIALLAAEPTKEALAAIMMQIYKDESLRLSLIRQGRQPLTTGDVAAVTASLRARLQQLLSAAPATGA